MPLMEAMLRFMEHLKKSQFLLYVAIGFIYTGVKKLRLQRFRDDRGGKNKHFLFDKTLAYAPFYR